MTRACQAMITYAFHTMKLNKVEIRCATENVRSRAIPERLGFKEEGLIRQAEWLYDHYVDLVVYGLLASEWPQNNYNSCLKAGSRALGIGYNWHVSTVSVTCACL